MEDDEDDGGDYAYLNEIDNKAVDALNLSKIRKAWQFPPLDSDEVIRKLGKDHRDVSQYICRELGNSPLCVHLKTKEVNIRRDANRNGVVTPRKWRAEVTVGSFRPKDITKAKKLRAVWSVRDGDASQSSRSDRDICLRKSYEEYQAIMNQRFDVELILPKIKSKKNSGANPVILYSTPMAEGTTQEDARVSQSDGIITVFPNGRKKGGDDHGIIVGATSLHLHAGPSSVDGYWARGRKFFWKGRSVGQL